jgi:chromate reductase
MITVISGTNRPGSSTLKIASYCAEYLKRLSGQDDVKLLDLQLCNQLPLLRDDMYEKTGMPDVIAQVQDEFLVDSALWLVISPEYNGGASGILKFFLDAVSVRKYKETFHHKKIALMGVSSGRAGNLRGMDQLTGIFHYLQADVMPQKLPVSSVHQLIDKEGDLQEDLQQTLNDFLEKVVAYSRRK